MIRIGAFDAFEKWEILSRHWAKKDVPSDLGVDKFNRPRLEQWHRAARSGGLAGCWEYILLNADRISRQETDQKSVAATENLQQETWRLFKELGHARLREMVERFVNRLTDAAPSGSELSPALEERLTDVFKMAALDRLQWTEDFDEIPTIDIIRKQRPRTFPIDAVKNKNNVLCLFCAQFYGRSDVIYVHDSCPDNVTLVDNNETLLNEMKLIYPKEWKYVCTDYKDFLQQATQERSTYDLIVCDEWPWIAREVVWNHLPSILDICPGTLIVDYYSDMLSELKVQASDLDGLSDAVTRKTGVDVAFTQMISRGRDTYWAVLRRR